MIITTTINIIHLFLCEDLVSVDKGRGGVEVEVDVEEVGEVVG